MSNSSGKLSGIMYLHTEHWRISNYVVISKQANAITVLDLCPELGFQREDT